MNATVRPNNVHFLAARGSLFLGKVFIGKTFPTKRIGASAASDLACAHQTIITFEFSLHAYVMTVHRSHTPEVVDADGESVSILK